MLCILPLLAALARGSDDNKGHNAAPNGTVPVSPYLNSFSIEFKDFPLFAGKLHCHISFKQPSDN